MGGGRDPGHLGRDVAGRLAAKLDVPVIANGLDVAANGDVSVQSSIFGATCVSLLKLAAARGA